MLDPKVFLLYNQVRKRGGHTMKKTMVELFAGVGGFRVALEKQGWETVWANQWEPSTKTQHAYHVYTAHFGTENVSNEDIEKVNKAEIPDHTLLVGGFPCQDYSVARTNAEGIQGKKGVLWWSIWETLEAKRPPFVLLENVDRLIKSPAKQRGRDFGVMLRSISDLGYSLEWRVINAADYGFPQRRRRVFLFAAHESTKYYKTLTNYSHKAIIFNKGIFSKEFPVKSFNPNNKKITETSIGKSKYKDLVKVSDGFSAKFYNAGVMINQKVMSVETTPVSVDATPLRELLENNPSEDLYINQNSEKWQKLKRMKGSKRELRTSANGYQYYYSEGGMSFPDSLDKPARTILTSETSINRSTHIIEDPKTKRPRLLSPVECERLNGFEDGWTNPTNSEIPIPKKRRYFLMGNALIVGVVKKIGVSIEKHAL